MIKLRGLGFLVCLDGHRLTIRPLAHKEGTKRIEGRESKMKAEAGTMNQWEGATSQGKLTGSRVKIQGMDSVIVSRRYGLLTS